MLKRYMYLESARYYPFSLYTVQEAAQLLRVTKYYIYKLVKQGVIKPIKARCGKGKNPKYCRSYFLNGELIKALDYRFPELLPQQKREIAIALLKGRSKR